MLKAITLVFGCFLISHALAARPKGIPKLYQEPPPYAAPAPYAAAPGPHNNPWAPAPWQMPNQLGRNRFFVGDYPPGAAPQPSDAADLLEPSEGDLAVAAVGGAVCAVILVAVVWCFAAIFTRR
ncbi:hypothetical protein PtA15_17A76 [Puccinia triticina]|uniref:Uncharacterized protein n=1 Tax=Puccinia triticina TaxID=208348 RepID=A0ABY7D6V6_9BASI|nr:uncharacterized protein PtA15_17A76 [Puccinia triticina]WAQ92595.1 hypothetical protein PtA15_17A76 [Puccinia triticina]